jgi:hypothetical protein
MAAPTVMTPEVIEKLEEAFMLGCTDIEACLAADISPATLYNYQEKYPEFLERKDKLKSNPIYKARKSVVDGLVKDPKLALDFLSRKAKAEFSTKTEVEHSGEINRNMSDEDIDAIIERGSRQASQNTEA